MSNSLRGYLRSHDIGPNDREMLRKIADALYDVQVEVKVEVSE